MKIFCIDESFAQHEGIRCIKHESPIAMIAGAPFVAKQIKWDSLDDFRNDAFISDTKNLDGTIELMEIDIKNIQHLQSLFPNEKGEHIEYTTNVEEADVLIARMFVS